MPCHYRELYAHVGRPFGSNQIPTMTTTMSTA